MFDDRQGSIRIDHRFNDKNLIYGRYRVDSQRASGIGQVTPPRHTLVNTLSSNAVTIVLNSVLTNRLYNEGRVACSLQEKPFILAAGCCIFPRQLPVDARHLYAAGDGLICCDQVIERSANMSLQNFPSFFLDFSRRDMKGE